MIGHETGQPKRASVRSINPPKRVNEQRVDRFTFYSFVGLLGRAWRARGPISNENTRPVKCYKSRNETWMARNLSNVCRSLADWLWAASAYVRGPSGFSRSVTRKRNESPIFRETSALSPTEAAQCSSLTRLLITIVSRTMSSIDRKSGRPCGGKYKSPMSETMRSDIRDCETERTADSPTRLTPSILIRIIIPRPPLIRFFIFSLLRSPVGRRETECVGKVKREEDRKMKKIAGDQFSYADKKCASEHLQFFSAWIWFARKMLPSSWTDIRVTSKNILRFRTNLYSVKMQRQLFLRRKKERSEKKKEVRSEIFLNRHLNHLSLQIFTAANYLFLFTCFRVAMREDSQAQGSFEILFRLAQAKVDR